MSIIANMTNKRILVGRWGIWMIMLTGVIVMIGSAIVNGQALYLGLLLIPVLIYLSVEKPFIFPFGTYAFLLPFDQLLSITDSSATLTKFLGILTILILCLKGLFEKKFKKPDTAALLWILLVLYGALSILWAIQPELALYRIKTAAGLLLLYLVISSYKIQKSEFDILKWCILAGGFFAAISAIYNYRSLESIARTVIQFGGRTGDLGRFPFDLLIPISICIEKILIEKKKIVKAILIILLGIMIFSIVITGTRSGLIGVGVIIIIYILSARKLSIATILLSIGIILLSLTPEVFVERWMEASETGGAGRTTIWDNGLIALKNYWTIGAGLNNFPEAYEEFAHFTPLSSGIGRGAHNTYLEIFVELGIIGFSLMVFGMWKHYQAIKSRLRSHDTNQVMLKAVFWAMFVVSFFLDTFWYKSFWLLWMMIMMHRNVMELGAYRYNRFEKEFS